MAKKSKDTGKSKTKAQVEDEAPKKKKSTGLDVTALYSDIMDDISKRQNYESSSLDVVPPISTGFLSVDLMLGGGIRSCMLTAAGNEQCAKTTLAIAAMANAITENVPVIAFSDFEGCVTEDTLIGYGKGRYARLDELFDLSDAETWKAGIWQDQTRTDIDTYESGHTNRGTGVRHGQLFYRGVKPTTRIETNLGVALTGYKHKMFVVRGSHVFMKFIEDVQVGEHVLVAKTSVPKVVEEWRPVVGFGPAIKARYEVSNLGRVRSLPYQSTRTVTSKNGKVFEQTLNIKGKYPAVTTLPDGHQYVCLVTPNPNGGASKINQQLIHRLVALAFIGKAPKGMPQVLHWNDNPADNRVTNLHWGNDAINSSERKLRGRAATGTDVHTSVLTPKKVERLLAMKDSGCTLQYAADKFGISNSQVWQIWNGNFWQEVRNEPYCELDLEAALVHYELAAVTKVGPTGKKERVYDVSLSGVARDEIPHAIVTNGILTHNSTKNSKPYVASILKTMGVKLSVDEVFGKRDTDGKWKIRPRVRYRSQTILERFYDWLSEILRDLPDKRYVEGKWWLIFDEKRQKKQVAKIRDFVDSAMTKKYGNGLWVPAPDDKIQGIIFLDSYTAMQPEAKDDEEISNQLSVKASAFSKQLERVKGRMADKMVTVYGLNHLRSNPMAMFGPKEDEKGGNALKQFSDVRIRQTSRSLSAAPFSPKGGKKGGENTYDEVEESVEFPGRKDQYRYVHLKTVKNKLWTPQRTTFIRIWVEDGDGQARGLCPVFDTILYLKETGQLKGTRAKFLLNLRGLSAGKDGLGKSKPMTWGDLKLWILGDKEQKTKMSKKAGYVPMDLRKYCAKQVKDGVADEYYVEYRGSKDNSKGDDEGGDE